MRTIDSKTDLVDPVPIQSPCQPLFISKVKTHHQRLLWATALDPAIPCRIITDDILSFCSQPTKNSPGLRGREQRPSPKRGRWRRWHRRASWRWCVGAAGRDRRGQASGKPCSSVVGCAEKWDQKHVLVAVGRAFFLMSFPITKLLVYTFVWFVFYGVLFTGTCTLFWFAMPSCHVLTLLACACRNSYSRCTGIWCLAVPTGT